ncbi:hypothetical protein N9258_02630, partial [Akkermansiaceae bacterium]|nr:hypothetical protein [Akkermansiaceae bacterium]
MKSFFLLLLSFLELQATQVKVAILGDSITFGSGATPIQANRYSTKLGKFLGDDYLVKTFAAGGLCLLQKADRPFLKTTHFTKVLN